MDQHTITPNEIIELHELLTFKDLSLTKSVAMAQLVSDDDLKTILRKDVRKTKRHIKELKGYISQSEIAKAKSIANESEYGDQR